LHNLRQVEDYLFWMKTFHDLRKTQLDLWGVLVSARDVLEQDLDVRRTPINEW
jgi:hypothetical protein